VARWSWFLKPSVRGRDREAASRTQSCCHQDVSFLELLLFPEEDDPPVEGSKSRYCSEKFAFVGKCSQHWVTERRRITRTRPHHNCLEFLISALHTHYPTTPSPFMLCYSTVLVCRAELSDQSSPSRGEARRGRRGTGSGYCQRSATRADARQRRQQGPLVAVRWWGRMGLERTCGE